jgi:mRNA interferase RelE/StbE
MSYSIFYSKKSEKYLLRLTPSAARRIIKHIHNLSLNPYKTDNNIVKLSGSATSYRMRIGDIRVIFFLDEKKKAVYVVKIAPRGSAYSF